MSSGPNGGVPRDGGGVRPGEHPVVRQPRSSGKWVRRALEPEVVPKRLALVLGAEDSSLLQLGYNKVDEIVERLGDEGGLKVEAIRPLVDEPVLELIGDVDGRAHDDAVPLHRGGPGLDTFGEGPSIVLWRMTWP